MTQEEFIRSHRTEDIRQLALKSHPEGIDIADAIEQIAGWQTACRKLPTWAATEGIVFPPHLSMEQCSSEPTALYKRRLAQKLVNGSAESIADLTGGFGVDFSYMAQAFRNATYVEQQERLCNIARHNFPLLGLQNAKIVCADGTSFLNDMPHVQILFLDPARRDTKGARTFAIGDCTPNVAELRAKLLEHADNVIVKLSPMLDWHKAATDMQGVSEVHIVAVKNECKELLLVLSNRKSDNEGAPYIYCADCTINSSGETIFSVETFRANDCAGNPLTAPCDILSAATENNDAQTILHCTQLAGKFLYEPNAAVMKAGCFSELSRRYGAQQAAKNSHLFFSPTRLPSFPGREFIIKAATGLNKKELKRTLAGIKKANVAVRNFPLSVAELRRKLKLADGGDTYIFATTLADGQKLLLLCSKVAAV